jgi:hypothetical protein
MRLLAVTLIVSLSTSSVAFAGESLLQSASRIVQKAAQEQVAGVSSVSATSGRSAAAATNPASLASRTNSPIAQALQSQPAALSKSGMKTRTKVMIYLAAGVGLAATAWTIDHKVVDVTPSSLGTRKD